MMRKVFWLVVFLLLISFVSGENLYQYDSLELKLNVEGELELVSEGSGAKVDSVRAELFLYPEDDFRQKLLNWNSEGEVEDDKVVFEWDDRELGEKEYGFEARIKTENTRVEVSEKIHFPLYGVGGFEEYLEATENIDKDNPEIIEKATGLAEGEDDLFKVVFKLAKWVEENVEYELTTLTADTSQKASWVLEHEQGVCDEMTSLFIAMCRALGIPARFVSGVSYTTSELFEENWLPHGWAEVYFLSYGWVSFDIAFGEYGYVDVSHIKLREWFDPAEASTKFEWLADKVDLRPNDKLKLSVDVKEKGSLSESEIFLEEKIIGEEVDLGSYNLVKGVVENKKDYYMATTLKLAVPKEVEVVGEEKKIILLEPNEVKEVFWLLNVDEDLRENYWYEFPIVIYSEKNVSVKEKFKAIKGGIFYSKKEAESLTLKEEEKRYLGKISLDCDYEKEIKLDEEKEVTCVIKNKGNLNLENIEFCVGERCEMIDLPINQEEMMGSVMKGEEIGWQKLMVKAEGEEIEKKISLEYTVLDDPELFLEIERPKAVSYEEDFVISLIVSKGSFSIPKEPIVVLEGVGFENTWEMDELKDEQEFQMELNSKGLGKENEFKIKLFWEDKFGEKFKEEQVVVVKVEGETFWEKTVIWFSGLFNLLR